MFDQLFSLLLVYRESNFQNMLLQIKSKRRLVLGLREVTKHLKLRKIKCVVISPNLERIQSKGMHMYCKDIVNVLSSLLYGSAKRCFKWNS